MSCKQIARLSTASAGGHASEAERLELEAHLATCARCNEEHAFLLAATRVLRHAEPGALPAAARERVRRAALSQRAHAPATVRRWGWPLAGSAVLAVAAAFAIWIGTRAPSHFSIVQGDIAVSGGPTAVSQDPPSSGSRGSGELTVRSARGGEVRLADASTTLAPTTEIVWRHERRVVELREGALTVDIPHREGQHFEVHTPHFIVEVVGTRFTVDMKGVMTERGMVRLLSPDGKLIGYVGGGHAWAMPETTAPATTPPPAPPAEAPPPREETAPAPTAAAPATAGGAPGTADEMARARLGRARRALARGNAGEARHAVEPLFRLGRDVASEARALYAESFLIESRYADAIDGYQVVVRDFPTTPQAESALFAVAQLEGEHGRTADARATLQRYLARYPRGRFAKEAADRLAAMTPPQPRP